MPTLPSDLSPGGESPYRGYIDSIHATHGVRGWAVNVATPRTPPTLALRVGSKTVARMAPNRVRDDISEALRQTVTAGFQFGPETLQRAAGMAAAPYDLITVCIDGTDLELDSATPPMHVRDVNIAAPDATHAPARPDARPPPGTEAAIDRLMVIPGLGCMAEGWVLSPQQPVTDFRLRLGGVTFTARADATYRKPRPDLVAAFPHAEALAPRAGFVALLTSDTSRYDLTSPILQLVLADGSTADIELPPNLPRLLGHTATAAEAVAFFPALTAESFFPAFAAAVIAAERAAAPQLVPIRLATTPKTFIHVLPDNRNDLFLAFATIAAACRENLLDGLTFIAADDLTRAEAPWHLQDLLARHEIPASLFTLGDTRHAFAALPGILRATGAKRFAYIAPNLFATLPAYRLAAAYVRGTAKSPLFLGPVPDSTAPAAAHAAPTSRCFAWTSQAFIRWSETAPVFLGGHYHDNRLAQPGLSATFHPNIVLCSRSDAPSFLEQAVNGAIYAAAQS